MDVTGMLSGPLSLRVDHSAWPNAPTAHSTVDRLGGQQICYTDVPLVFPVSVCPFAGGSSKCRRFLADRVRTEIRMGFPNLPQSVRSGGTRASACADPAPPGEPSRPVREQGVHLATLDSLRCQAVLPYAFARCFGGL